MQIISTFMTTLAVVSLSASIHWTAPSVESTDVREEIKKTVTLAPGAQVSISGINGRVNVETGEGNQAEIHIVITASDREALERRPLLVEDTPNSLTIRTDQREKGGRDGGWIRHQVQLRLPRAINLAVSSVNGGVDVGAITGSIGIRSVNGGARVEQAGSATEITSVNGRVAISLRRLGESGLRVSSINGGVELNFASEVDAELEVRGINGGIDCDFPLKVVGEMKRNELRGTIGAGGPKIEITSVNGGVSIKHAGI